MDDPSDLDHLFALAYEELRRLAALARHREFVDTLNPTGLVHELYLKLAKSPHAASYSYDRLIKISVQAMRNVMTDMARRRLAQRRGGGRIRVPLTDAVVPEEGFPSSTPTSEQLLMLDEALKTLALEHPREASVVEHVFFGALELKEVAELLGVSERTVNRDLAKAKLRLLHLMQARS